ncbi:hypothetical protein DFP72DRAFT_1167888 [Ephemerocybe angulata]|uniref:Uncharacterized protein n=1 Tax=Ephemerocybe angulata TaxID=980116 RepID=A0A8H6MAI6_9AGAR|nr:hypothetical protein DFP72DRAFT_1167888 [Tulosesus angulatus]
MISRRKKVKTSEEEALVAPAQRLPESVLSTPEILGNIVELFLGEKPERTGLPFRRAPSPIWLRTLLPLLVVNRDFFHATVCSLWKDMHSFHPFIQLLPLMTEEQAPEVLDPKCEDDVWGRFKLYASSTTTLVLNGEGEGPWISHIVSLPFRPQNLFPKLQMLDVRVAKITTCVLLPIVAPHLKKCTVSNADEKDLDTTKFTLATLSTKAENLSTLRIAGPLTAGSMDYVHRIRGLRNLVISSKKEPLEKHIPELVRLNAISTLKALTLDYVIPSVGNTMEESYSPAVEDCLGTDAMLPDLEELLVSGDGLTQHMIARGIALPNNLRQLDLLCREPDEGREFLMPFALRVYLERNKELQRLRVKWEEDPRARLASPRDPREAFFTKNPVFTKSCDQFLPALSRQTSLTELKIDGISFFDDDILSKICEVVPNFPNLVRLTLRTTLSATYENYTTTPPPFTVLETIARACPLLEWINMPVAWVGFVCPRIVLPSRMETPHKLTRLWIGGGDVPAGLSGSIAIGRYLNTLFPNLKYLANSRGGRRSTYKTEIEYGTVNPDFQEAMNVPSTRLKYECGGRGFWEEIQELVRSYTQARLEGMRDSQSSKSS